MRLERLNYNKIKIFLTLDDLTDRGLTKEDLWKDSFKVQQLFKDMMNEANTELGFEANGPIAVEVYSLQAQGMVIIVTKNQETDEDDNEYDEDYIEMQVKLGESVDIIYEFQTFEHLIELSKNLDRIGIQGGTVYHYEDRYFLSLDDFDSHEADGVISILAEYGNPTTLTIYRLQEYGKKIMEKNAVQTIQTYFK
ncbi:genetic competence negative regulator [Bacillus paralicheniformis]|uniref:genetic competence negative regulator n=1 Tax=Bacillus paralicheniformis TaxID=1648923 RepID=UPI00224453F4|nr:genetic competence negative regulator [Bacillus paralicheniformis]MEC1022173.1 genetic competence negative regulator [Bacillus paralicheniformis]MEC1025561.1 genetic competence negative regulator [Bacillus paralicheniformis]MEC1035097.1 genetic competence negative regulator [Bacillus paralicheniformis]MEC1050609.1 genetic competence negative regulator [Bacillus paralicheniformis]MEC1058235.1 genetic competence negative regulator [Bacillus paralicheniformis]